MSDIVYVLQVEHKHGSNYSVHRSQEGALAALFQFVAQWWQDEMQGEPMPESEGDAIQQYFGTVQGRESFTLEECELAA